MSMLFISLGNEAKISFSLWDRLDFLEIFSNNYLSTMYEKWLPTILELIIEGENIYLF